MFSLQRYMIGLTVRTWRVSAAKICVQKFCIWIRPTALSIPPPLLYMFSLQRYMIGLTVRTWRVSAAKICVQKFCIWIRPSALSIPPPLLCMFSLHRYMIEPTWQCHRTTDQNKPVLFSSQFYCLSSVIVSFSVIVCCISILLLSARRPPDQASALQHQSRNRLR